MQKSEEFLVDLIFEGKMLRLCRQILDLQSLTRHFVRSLASFDQISRNSLLNKRWLDNKKRKNHRKGKALTAEDTRKISNLFHGLLTKNHLKLRREEGSNFEITAKELALACREQHSVYITDDKVKLEKPITRFGNHKVQVAMRIMGSAVPLKVIVEKAKPIMIESVENKQITETDREEVKVDGEESAAKSYKSNIMMIR